MNFITNLLPLVILISRLSFLKRLFKGKRLKLSLISILIAIVVILVLSASMSTLSSLVLTSSSTITLDFIAPLRKKDLQEKSKLSIMRVFVVLFIVISATIAIIQAKSSVTFIAQLMGISWGALAGAFLAPFLYGLYWKRVSVASVWVCFGFLV